MTMYPHMKNRLDHLKEGGAKYFRKNLVYKLQTKEYEKEHVFLQSDLKDLCEVMFDCNCGTI